MLKRVLLSLFAVALLSRFASADGDAQKTPEQAWEDVKSFYKAKDAKGLWNMICEESRKSIMDEMKKSLEQQQEDDDAAAEAAKELGCTVDEFKKLTTEEYMLLALKKQLDDKDEQEKMEKTKLKGVAVDGDKAVATTIKPDGKEEKAVLVKEGGTWKINIKASDDANGHGDEDGGQDHDEGSEDK